MSPVIGVILMVAITVIPTADIGTIFFEPESGVQKTTPQAQSGLEVTNSSTGSGANCFPDSAEKEVTITHGSAGAIDPGTLYVTCGPDSSKLIDCMSFPSGARISANSSWSVSALGGYAIRVIWNSAEGDKNATIVKLDVPG